MRCRFACCLALLALGGCRQIFGLSDPLPDAAAGSSDGASDARGVDGSGSDGNSGFCLGATGWKICVPMPTAPVTLPATIDTESTFGLCMQTQPASWSGAGQPHACIIVGTTITGSSITATGNFPLVLVASDSISIGSLDVSSHGGGADPGGGAGSTACMTAGVGTSSVNGAGGGAGGSFMTKGGDGGSGNSGAAAKGTATAADPTAPSSLRGGCRGGSGGDGGTVGNHGRGGDGGGATYLVAGTKITITGTINASGAGGTGGGSSNGGGGGGGTGGSIILHAPSIIATGATLVANGGGGGAGAAGATAGGTGSNPNASSPTTPAPGSTTGGGAGGNGFAGSTAATGGANASQGGGGGGGSSGYIRANVVPSGASTSPNVDIQ